MASIAESYIFRTMFPTPYIESWLQPFIVIPSLLPVGRLVLFYEFLLNKIVAE